MSLKTDNNSACGPVFSKLFAVHMSEPQKASVG